MAGRWPFVGGRLCHRHDAGHVEDAVGRVVAEHRAQLVGIDLQLVVTLSVQCRRGVDRQPLPCADAEGTGPILFEGDGASLIDRPSQVQAVAEVERRVLQAPRLEQDRS